MMSFECCRHFPFHVACFIVLTHAYSHPYECRKFTLRESVMKIPGKSVVLCILVLPIQVSFCILANTT
jgi:hypothetical protein